MDNSYKEVNGTSYHQETPNEVILILEASRLNKNRLLLDYGDVKTGKSWGESYDIVGHIGRSNGSIKIPLLIHNKRSLGGCGLLDHCIIKISNARGKAVLYDISK